LVKKYTNRSATGTGKDILFYREGDGRCARSHILITTNVRVIED